MVNLFQSVRAAAPGPAQYEHRAVHTVVLYISVLLIVILLGA